MIAAGQFRQDLYFRIAELTVTLPALRERGDDVVLVAKAILAERAQQHGRSIRGFTPGAVAALRSYPWPGNIRELQNRVNSAVIMCEGTQVEEGDLGLPSASGAPEDEVLNLRMARQKVELACVQRALARADGSVTRAASCSASRGPRFTT